MTVTLDFLATHQILTILVVLALGALFGQIKFCLLYTSPSPRDRQKSRMPSSA